MIIDRLVLKNFKRFRNEEIRFRDGITGILGNNGTGKSSIVEAIFFALYGVEKTGSLKSDYILSSFASPKDPCEVRLDFRIGGTNYSVIRTFKNGKTVPNKTTFHREEKLFATGVREVETEVKRTIGMGRVDFMNTIYAAQKDLLTLLESDPSKRKEWFLRALGIDYLNRESQNILKDRVEAKTDEQLSLNGELKAITRQQGEIDPVALQTSVGEYKSALASLKKQHGELDAKKKYADKEYQQFQDQKTEYTKLVERKDSLTKEKDSLVRQRQTTLSKIIDLTRAEQEFRAMEQKISGYPVKKQVFEELRKQKEAFDQTTTAIQFSERDRDETKKRKDQLEKKIADLSGAAEKRASLIAGIRKTLKIGPETGDDQLEQYITSMVEEITHTIGALSARQKGLDGEKKKLLADWNTIQEAGAEGVCPLCRQKLADHVSIEAEFTSRIRHLDEEIAGLRDTQERAQREKNSINAAKPALSEIRSLSEKITVRTSFETDLKDLIPQLQKKEETCHSLHEQIRDLQFDDRIYHQAKRELEDLEKDQKQYGDLREKVAQISVFKGQVRDHETRIKEKQEEMDQVVEKIQQSAFDPQKIETLERSREEIDTALRTVEAETSRTTELLRQADEKITQYKNTEDQIRNLKKQTGDLQEEIELLKLTRSIIADYVVYLMQVVRSRIEGEVSRIISEITSGRYEQVLLDEDFNLLVRDIDDDYAIDRFSGGEQDDIAVALRIALSRYLAELHGVHESTVLIFDEIFGSQDEERRANLLTALRSQESRFPQIILISHIAEIQGEFANTLMVEMGTDQSSRVREAA
jgi:exonuclease SbcC